jgi:hypothetical protein
MEYGNIIRRAVNIVWQNKYLIVLGILAALGSGIGGGGGGGGGGGSSNGGAAQGPDISGEVSAFLAGAIGIVICVAILVGILLWAISAIARGGLVASVDTIEEGGKSSFSHGWRAAREKTWTLLGIGLLPGIPGLIMFVAGLGAFAAYGGLSALLGERFAVPAGMGGLGGLLALLACVVVPIVLLLTILRSFAERAAMLEGLGVMDSYRRGWNVLTANLGEATLLFLLQIAIFIILGLVFFVPGILIALCCLLWPLLLVIQGGVSAAVSAIWTLAWREWTGGPKLVEKAPDAF